MEVWEMRKALKNCDKWGHSMKWHDKVDAMPDKQVKAVYFRAKEAGDLKPIKIGIKH